MLTAEDFQALNSRQPGLRRSLGRAVRSRLSRADQLLAMQRLGKMPIFAELPPQTLQAIAQRMVLQHMPAGERVYRVGEVGDAMYLIESGEIELSAENTAGVLEEIGRIGGDGYFGEMSLVTGQIRTEDATSTRNTNLWILYKADLDALATQQPAIGKALEPGGGNPFFQRRRLRYGALPSVCPLCRTQCGGIAPGSRFPASDALSGR